MLRDAGNPLHLFCTFHAPMHSIWTDRNCPEPRHLRQLRYKIRPNACMKRGQKRMKENKKLSARMSDPGPM